jgi:hypothetical protein
MIVEEVERILKEVLMAYVRHHAGICLEGIKNTVKMAAIPPM